MLLKTTDLCDQFENVPEVALQVVAPMFKCFGKKRAFSGKIVTLKIFEDNSLVREALSENGDGQVLVVDGGGSMRCALLGDQLGILAEKNGWQGVIVYGCIRDSDDINQLEFGVRALDTHPKKSVKKGIGEKNIAVTFGGVTFTPGHWLCADADGVIVVSREIKGRV
ncbi:MAG: ribonuclease E activity regulator RraA [Burkholderiales bacterium]|jgi:regulator of ribonuclease activity A|nr:ribonuclease E activity regulator RraA [Burkholderiales bacterium]